MSKISETIKEEIKKLIPPSLFFFVTLQLIAVIRVLMLKGTGLPVSIINRFPDRPLVYNVA